MGSGVGRKRLLKVAVMALVLTGSYAVTPPPHALATHPICTVDDSGGAEFTTIQAAEADPACTTIVVAAGTYTGPVEIDRPVVIQGNNVGINPITGARVVESVLNSGTDGIVIYIRPDIDVTIDGLNIDVADDGIRHVLSETMAGADATPATPIPQITPTLTTVL